MRHKITRSLRTGDKFRREFRREIRMLIIIALGFTIAFTWRQTIFDASKTLVNFFIKTNGPTTLSFLASLLITILAVLLIYLTAHFLKDDPKHH